MNVFSLNNRKLLKYEDLYKTTQITKQNYYKDCLDMYMGKHWEYPKEDGMPQVTLNYCGKIIDILNNFLFNNGWTIEYYDEEQDALQEALEKVWDIWNNRLKISLQIGKQGLITGDVFILVDLIDVEPYVDDNGDIQSRPLKDKYIKIHVLDSQFVFPYWNPYDREDLIRIDITYPVPREYTHNGKVQIEEELYQKIITSDSIVEKINGNNVSESDNPLGFIPVIHIKNKDLPQKFYGKSELDNIIDLNREFNEKNTDISDILDYFGQPITVVKGISAKNIQFDGRLWTNLPKDADAFNLELKGDLGAATNYVKLLKQAIHEISGVPEVALGATQAVSNTSSIALQVQYLPLLNVIKEKQILYGDGLAKINTIILKIMEINNMIKPSVIMGMTYPYRTKIKFESALPKDEITELQNLTVKLQNNLESREGALKKLHVENPSAKIKEIDEAKERDAKLNFEIMNKYNPAPEEKKPKVRTTSGQESGTGINNKYKQVAGGTK